MIRHFTEGAYNNCDRNSPFMQSVLRCNRSYQTALIEEFLRIIKERGLSQVKAINEIKSRGGLVGRQNLRFVRNGKFKSISFTYANIISQWCGYSGFVELINAVETYKRGEMYSRH